MRVSRARLLFLIYKPIPPETIEAVHNCKGRIIAVGTTSVRTLETFAIGKRQLNPGIHCNRVICIAFLLTHKDMGECLSKLFIWPGGKSKFQIIDGMFTNFRILS